MRTTGPSARKEPRMRRLLLFWRQGGRDLKLRVNACLTKEEIDAVVDDR